jgi:hypothetical protein
MEYHIYFIVSQPLAQSVPQQMTYDLSDAWSKTYNLKIEQTSPLPYLLHGVESSLRKEQNYYYTFSLDNLSYLINKIVEMEASLERYYDEEGNITYSNDLDKTYFSQLRDVIFDFLKKWDNWFIVFLINAEDYEDIFYGDLEYLEECLWRELNILSGCRGFKFTKNKNVKHIKYTPQ